jgi:hypothetical protein
MTLLSINASFTLTSTPRVSFHARTFAKPLAIHFSVLDSRQLFVTSSTALARAKWFMLSNTLVLFLADVGRQQSAV